MGLLLTLAAVSEAESLIEICVVCVSCVSRVGQSLCDLVFHATPDLEHGGLIIVACLSVPATF